MANYARKRASKARQRAKTLARKNNKGSSNRLESQITNYGKRLENIGIDKEKVTDKRNWLEKTLNLEKDQNVLFDALEILGRPQNALFRGIEKTQEGGKFSEGLKEGITGEEKTTGKDLLVNAGMKDREGKLDLSDVLGFGLDVVADPMDIPLLPVAAGAKGAKALTSGSELVMRGLGKGVKGTAKLADKGIQKALGTIDAKQLKQISKIATKTGQSAEDILKQVGKSDLLGNYNQLKKGFKTSVDSSKAVGGLVGRARNIAGESDVAEALSLRKLKGLKEQTNTIATKIAQETGQDANEVMSKLSKDLTRLIESEQDTKIDGVRFLKNLSKNSNEFKGTKESVAELNNLLSQFKNIKYKVADDGLSLKINTKKSKDLNAFKNNPEVQTLFSKLKLNKDLGYTPEQLEELKVIKDSFSKNPELNNLLNEHKKAYSDIAGLYKDQTGTDLSPITNRQGYVRRSQGELGKMKDENEGFFNGFQGQVNKKSFASRKYAEPAEVTNLKEQEKIKSTIEANKKRIQTEVNSLAKNKKAILENQLENVALKKQAKIDKFNKNMSKLQDRSGKLKASLKEVNDTRNNIVNSLDDKIIEKAQKIQDTTISTSLSKTSTKVNNLSKEYNDIVKKLVNEDLTPKEMERLSKKGDKISNELKKAQIHMDASIARVRGYADDKTLSIIGDTNRSLVKSEKNALKEAKLSSQLGVTELKSELLKDSTRDSIAQLDDTIKNIELKLGAISPEQDAMHLKKIERLEKANSILASEQGKELFDLDFYAGMEDFIKQSTNYSKGAAIYNDALMTGLLNDKSYLQVIDDVKNKELPKGFVKIDGNKLAQQLEAVKGVLPENSDALKELSESFKGKMLYADKDFANILKLTKTTSEQASPLVKMIDKLNNTFKKYKVLTPGFQLRNITGNATNMVLSGMPAARIPEYYAKATKVWNSADNILDKVSKGIKLSAEETKNWEILQQFYKGGFVNAGTRVQDLEDLRKTVQGKNGLLSKAVEGNAKLNESMDRLNRLSLLMYANDNPKYLKNLGKDNAIDAVKYALFDPSNMSDFEKKVMKKIVPFYTFTKQNLLFQGSNLIKNTPKYKNLYKAFRDMYSDLGEDEYYDYQKEGMQISLPFSDDKGNRLYLKSNLPVSDLGEYLENPLTRAVSSTSPLIRVPFEMVTGKNTFTGQDNNYKTYSNFFKNMGMQVPKGVSDSMGAAEHILSGLGIDTITTNMIKKVSSIIEGSKGNKDPNAVWAEIFRSVLQNTNEEKVKNTKLYKQLEDYQEYMNYLKEQGIDVPTIREMTRSNSVKLNRMKNKRANRYR